MTNGAHQLPNSIVRAIEKQNFSVDSLIYYKEGEGWVYQQREGDEDQLVNSSPRSNPSEAIGDARPLDSLGPFGIQPTNISISIIPGIQMYKTSFDRNLSLLAKYEIVAPMGQYSPLVPVTLTGAARDVAHIPAKATHFCWAYPPAGLVQLPTSARTEIEQHVTARDPSYTFFSFGGFVYWQSTQSGYDMLQANALVKANNGLVFGSPLKWRSAYTADLQRQGRLQSVTISSLSQLGIKYYCFISPNEKLKNSKGEADWTPSAHGAFVYLYQSSGSPHPLDRYFTIVNQSSCDKIPTQVMPFSLIRNPTTTPASNVLTSNPPDHDRYCCSICFNRTIECILIPCKHMCSCLQCAQVIKESQGSNCPMCRQPFTEVWNVFL